MLIEKNRTLNRDWVLMGVNHETWEDVATSAGGTSYQILTPGLDLFGTSTLDRLTDIGAIVQPVKESLSIANSSN